MTEFTVSLERFEGPLDLMLFLISQKKLDLFDLNIDLLIDQYIAYIQAVDDKLTIASEYLSELANLVEYKSKKLLPKDTSMLDASNVEEDPKEALIKRILEYQRFKEISQVLNTRYEERSLQLEKPLEASVFSNSSMDYRAAIDAKPDDLIKAMQKIMQRFTITHPNQVKISKVEISIEARTQQLLLAISTLRDPFTFDDLVQDVDHIHLLIITFLSILEMTRKEHIQFELVNETVLFRKGRHYGIDA